MSPAFASPRQAGVFAALLLILLLLPALIAPARLPPRAEVYSALSSRHGPFPYVGQQIFDETEAIDIAFVGSSHMLSGIDTPYVQQQLSERLGRKAAVLTIGWGGGGFDGLYFVVQDLLRHRKVRMLVIYDEYCGLGRDTPQHLCSHWFRFGEDPAVLPGLPGSSQIALYGSAILGMPRSIVSMLRPNLSAQWVPGKQTAYDRYYHASDPAERLGSLSARLAFNDKPGFVAYAPHTSALPADALVYAQATKASFRFTGPATPPYQLHFARLAAAAAQRHGSKLVMLHLPRVGEMQAAEVEERELWSETLQAPVSLVGIPPKKFFADLAGEQVAKLYYDAGHMNKNGQEYFTPLVTPVLLNLYDAAQAPE